MKHILLLLCLFTFVFTTSAQYKDSLKTFRKLTKSFQKSSDFVFIPAGSYIRGSNDSDIPTPAVNGNYLRSSVMTVNSFFMEKFEVSNYQYLEFVNDMIRQDSVLGKSYLPDTLVWRIPESYNEPYVEYYLRHPAYGNYPVVGVSYAQVVAFAEWRTVKYNANEERIFKKVRFRIPTEEEWEYASKGDRSYSYLPCGSHSTLDENGAPRAKFRAVSQLSVYRDSIPVQSYRGEIKKRPAYLSNGLPLSMASINAGGFTVIDVTRPVDAFEPNSYGLFNMAGNVEEIVDAYYFREEMEYSFSYNDPLKSDKPWGVTKGGSWNDTGYYLQYPVRQFYTDQHSTSSEIGFRLVMDVLDY